MAAGSCGQPRNRRRADVIARCNLAAGFASVPSLDRLALLLRRQLRLASNFHAVSFGALLAIPSSSARQFALDPDNTFQRVQRESPIIRGGVRPCLASAKGSKLSSPLGATLVNSLELV